MEKDDLENWLNNLPVLTTVGDKARDEFKALLGGDAMTAFLGLLLGTRQGYYAQLSNYPLGNAESSCRASVIQGHIKGIDMVIDTVRELAQSPKSEEGAGS